MVQVWDLRDGKITERTTHPSAFGLTPTPLSTVAGGTPLENSLTLVRLLDNELPPTDPIENFVVLNAAALLLVAGKATDEKHGVELARESIRNGKAKEAIEKFRKASSRCAEQPTGELM